MIDNSCVGLKPVYISKSAILEDADAKQILAINEWGAKHCGWKPTRQ